MVIRRASISRRCAMATAVMAVLLAAGCGTASSAGGGPTAGGTVASPVPIDETANGQTVHVSAGQLLVLDLYSGYWQNVGSSSPSVLATQGEVMRLVKKGNCVVGGGCGTFETDLRAFAPGTAVISASRTTCGEAMACAPDKRHFAVTVVVDH